MHHDMVQNVVEVVRHNDRIIQVKLVLGQNIYHVMSVYAPQVGLSAEEKEEFWEKLEDLISLIPERDGIIVGGDLNGHIGHSRYGYEDVMGVYGFGDLNEEGRSILNFCKNQNLRISNTFFQKPREKQITYKSGGIETQIDFVLYRPRRGFQVRDCAAIPGECCLTQHRLVRAKFLVSDFVPRRWRGVRKPKVWKLKDDEIRAEFEAKFVENLQQRDLSWNAVQESLSDACQEVCGVTTGRRGAEQRESWWWNDDVRRAIKAKKDAYKLWQRSGREDDKKLYKMLSKISKREVARAKSNAWEEWSVGLNSNSGRLKMFKIAKQMRNDRQDICGTNFIKDEEGDILTASGDVADRWKRYFEGLLNSENPSIFEDTPATEGPIMDIAQEEVEAALRRMKRDKAPGPSGVTSDLLKYAGAPGLEALTAVFQKIMEEEVSPPEWSVSLTLPLYKKKGDALLCGKYRSLRLLEHAMKGWEHVLLARLKEFISIDPQQFGFQAGRSTSDAIFIIRQLQEKYSSKKKTLYHIFVDLEKAFDKVPREAVRWALRRKKVPERLVELVCMLYNHSTSKVKVAGVLSEEFPINVGVHQGSALSPLLFVAIVDEVSKECRRGDPWELLYADDLVLTAETKEGVISMFEEWKEAMVRRGLRINIDKTKLLVSGKPLVSRRETGRYPCGVCGSGVGANSILCTQCNKWVHGRCSGERRLASVVNFICSTCLQPPRTVSDESIVVEDGTIEEVESFCYLGDVLDRNCTADAAVRARISAAWGKWREISSLLCNGGIPLKKRATVYEACIRSVLLYGSETWPVTKRLEDLLLRSDRRMIRLMCGVTLRMRVPSEDLLLNAGLVDIRQVIKRNRLRMYGHVARRDEDEPLGKIINLEAPGRRPPGRPKKSWNKNVDEDLTEIGATREEALDRDTWRAITSRLTS